MKKLFYSMLVLALCVGCLLVYRNQKIQGSSPKDDYQLVVVDSSFLIEEPELLFEFPEHSRVQFYHVTTDWFIPVLALYHRQAVQTVTFGSFAESIDSFMVYETDKEYPIDFECSWSVLEATEKASVSMGEFNQYILYRILTQEKEIIVQFDPAALDETDQIELTECIMENYARFSE